MEAVECGDSSPRHCISGDESPHSTGLLSTVNADMALKKPPRPRYG